MTLKPLDVVELGVTFKYLENVNKCVFELVIRMCEREIYLRYINSLCNFR